MKLRAPVSALGVKQEEISTDVWMIPYADLMSNMMILFLALYAASASQSAKAQHALDRVRQAFAEETVETQAGTRLRESELAVELEETLRGLALTDFGVRVTSRYVHLTLPTPVLFRTGSYRLSPDARRVLEPLSRILARVPNPVLVEGHTDDTPIVGGRYRTNWELSAARAFSVIRYFGEEGLEPGRFHARGYGEFRPVASNGDEAGKAANRRIEIRLLRERRRAE